jgi:hypothetical protein
MELDLQVTHVAPALATNWPWKRSNGDFTPRSIRTHRTIPPRAQDSALLPGAHGHPLDVQPVLLQRSRYGFPQGVEGRKSTHLSPARHAYEDSGDS